MQITKQLFIIENDHIIPLIRDLDNSPQLSELKSYSGKTIKVAIIYTEIKNNNPYAVINSDFIFFTVNEKGHPDVGNHETWKPNNNEFRTIISLALKKNLDLKKYKIFDNPKMPLDDSDKAIVGIRNLINSFPGLEVIGNNLSLIQWSITFDVINPQGLISLLFLTKGLDHDIAKECSLSIESPDNNMRYTLSSPCNKDKKKASLWVIFIYQKRIEYKEKKRSDNL